MSERDEGKIALEEHFYLSSFEAYGADGSALDGAGKAHNYDPEYFASVQKRLGDVKLWLEDMDRCGIERMVLSLTQPGIQGIPDRAIAVDTAKRMNDDLAQILAGHPNRFLGFAAVALQDVRAAGDELERAVSQLGFKGAMINGYSNIGDMDTRPIPRRAASMGFLGARGSAWRANLPAPPEPVSQSAPRRRNGRAYASSDLEWVVRPLSPTEDHSRTPR